MANAKEHRTVEAGEDSEGCRSRVPLMLSTVSFFAFPIALAELQQVQSAGELIVMHFALVLWMLATLVGIRSVAPTRVIPTKDALRRSKRICALQFALLAAGVMLLAALKYRLS